VGGRGFCGVGVHGSTSSSKESAHDTSCAKQTNTELCKACRHVLLSVCTCACRSDVRSMVLSSTMLTAPGIIRGMFLCTASATKPRACVTRAESAFSRSTSLSSHNFSFFSRPSLKLFPRDIVRRRALTAAPLSGESVFGVADDGRGSTSHSDSEDRRRTRRMAFLSIRVLGLGRLPFSTCLSFLDDILIYRLDAF